MLKFFLFFIFFLLTVLIFCPIKLKIKIILSEKDLQIFFYKYKVFSFKKLLEKKKLENAITSDENYGDKNDNLKESESKIKKPSKKVKKVNIKKLIHILYHNKFRPSLKFSLDITYSTEDAALTAISYGLIHKTLSFLYLILDTFFDLKKFYKEINPQFNDINSILFEIESIITISFAQIIYIGFLYIIPKRDT